MRITGGVHVVQLWRFVAGLARKWRLNAQGTMNRLLRHARTDECSVQYASATQSNLRMNRYI